MLLDVLTAIIQILGALKYDKLGIKYTLANLKPLSLERIHALEDIFKQQ